jgi:IclR family pca regulon transcriptional regulator
LCKELHLTPAFWAQTQEAHVSDTTELAAKDISLTFLKGMTVLRAFDEDHSHLTLAEIARITGIERAVVRRLVLTLLQLGYVRKDDNRFSLTPHVLVLAGGFLRGNQFGRLIQPLIEICAREVGFSVGLAMRDGDDAVYVAQSQRVTTRCTFGFTIGSRLPLLSTAIGRALLAWGDQVWADGVIAHAALTRFTTETVQDRAVIAARIGTVRQTGISVVDGEFEAGAIGIAVPVGPIGHARAALGLSEPASALHPERQADVTMILQRYATEIAAVMR